MARLRGLASSAKCELAVRSFVLNAGFLTKATFRCSYVSVDRQQSFESAVDWSRISRFHQERDQESLSRDRLKELYYFIHFGCVRAIISSFAQLLIHLSQTLLGRASLYGCPFCLYNNKTILSLFCAPKYLHFSLQITRLCYADAIPWSAAFALHPNSDYIMRAVLNAVT